MQAPDMLSLLFRPIYKLVKPHVEGLEYVNAKVPSLFVANHTSLGVLDVPFFWLALRDQADVKLRALAHEIFFQARPLANVMHAIGAVAGTRENCAKLMEQGDHILVFPGGGAEVAKPKGRKYQLLWKERLGFVRMAATYKYPIIPFASVGAEELYDIRYDHQDLQKSLFGPLLKYSPVKLEEIPPIVTGWKGTPLPKPERFYFKFSPPVATSHIDPENDAECRLIKEKVKSDIETSLSHLLQFRDSDPLRYPLKDKLPAWFKHG